MRMSFIWQEVHILVAAAKKLIAQKKFSEQQIRDVIHELYMDFRLSSPQYHYMLDKISN